MKKNKDVYWVRKDVFQNSVTLPMWVWDQHASKHEFDEVPATEEHIFQAIIDPDHARRSFDPVVGGEGCVFEKYFPNIDFPLFVPVLYEDVQEPNEYELGGKQGRVLTGYFETRQRISSSIGPIFWSKPVSGEDDSK